ncbi:VOC family protein [Ideonella sp. YS5]|uniref:VOC family protein n=1 Tax=Ideonella sp. YS5 TaxID=3453714 RepID=UPI003EEE0DD2
MAGCLIDHLTITAPTLEAGAKLVEGALGVSAQRGGQHPRMGTHNLLLRLGDAMFLEVIATDPAAPAPPRPRWFALDELAADAAPGLSCWVVRTSNIRDTAAAATEPLGTVEPMSRGALNWLITLPEDGRPPLGGVGPALIEWHTEAHPAMGLQDLGCRLAGFELLHPQPRRAEALLVSLGFNPQGVKVEIVEAPHPALRARILTPQGLRTLAA